jgi:hypothetical protein
MAIKKRAKYTSKGERRPTDRAIRNALRREKSAIDVILDKQEAWLKGKNPWITIDNPNDKETNKRKIRARANDVWGDYRARFKHPTEKTAN